MEKADEIVVLLAVVSMFAAYAGAFCNNETALCSGLLGMVVFGFLATPFKRPGSRKS